MVRVSTKAMMLVPVLALGCVAASWGQSKSDDGGAAAEGIKQSLSDWSNGYNHHDPKVCAMGFADDADMVSLAGIRFHGRKAIEDHYTRTFATSLANAQRTDTIKSVRFLSPEIAAVDDEFEIVGSTSRTVATDHTVIPPRHGVLQMIYVKKDGKWSVAVSHETETAEAPKK